MAPQVLWERDQLRVSSCQQTHSIWHLRSHPSFPVPRILLEHWSKDFICAHPQRTNTRATCPSAHPQSAASASGCNWRTESLTAAPAPSCICHNCDFDGTKWECRHTFGRKVQTHFSHCPTPHTLLLFLFFTPLLQEMWKGCYLS